MPNIQTLKLQYGLRFEQIIESSQDPKGAMNELALEAEKVGLVDSASSPRRGSPLEFVQDLWNDNPAVNERLSVNLESLQKPLNVRSLSDALDVLR